MVRCASMAVIRRPAVSSLPPSRMEGSLSMAQTMADSSIGWCDGPSSPVLTESGIAMGCSIDFAAPPCTF